MLQLNHTYANNMTAEAYFFSKRVRVRVRAREEK